MSEPLKNTTMEVYKSSRDTLAIIAEDMRKELDLPKLTNKTAFDRLVKAEKKRRKL